MNQTKVNIIMEVPRRYMHHRNNIYVWFRYIEDAIGYKSEERYEDDFELGKKILTLSGNARFKYRKMYNRKIK